MIPLVLTLAALACRSRLHARALLLVLVGACAPQLDTGTFSRHVGNRLVAGELAPASEPKRVRVELAPREDLAPDPIFGRSGTGCVGPWADNSDVRTRYVTHPDTGLCAFACAAAEHVLLCDELGGTCAPASDGRSYCGGAP